jgi:hypothetical protein
MRGGSGGEVISEQGKEVEWKRKQPGAIRFFVTTYPHAKKAKLGA